MQSDEIIERIARKIASELGDEFDMVPANKGAWIRARGMCGGLPRDINAPFQGDYLSAATAAYTEIQVILVERDRAVVAFIREQGDVADSYALASDEGSTRRAAYGGAGYGCAKLADAIERGEHLKARTALKGDAR